MDITPSPITGVLGLGNLLCGDEGFGVHVIRHLETHYSFPDSVLLMDGGTAGIYMGPFLEEIDHLIVIDVLQSLGDPGAIITMNETQVRGAIIQTSISPHQLGLLEVMDICRLRDRCPKTVQFICTIPASLETCLELSPALQKTMGTVAHLTLAALENLGVPGRKKMTS